MAMLDDSVERLELAIEQTVTGGGVWPVMPRQARRSELNKECLTIRDHQYIQGNLLDEVCRADQPCSPQGWQCQRLLQKQGRELHASRFQLTELVGVSRLVAS